MVLLGSGPHNPASVGVALLYVLRWLYFWSETVQRDDSLEGFFFCFERVLRMSFIGKAS